MKNIWQIIFCIAVSLCLSCKENTGYKDNSELQTKLLAFTKVCNKEAKANVKSPEKIKEIKAKYKKKVDSINMVENWTGRITMLDLDEHDAYSKDTVIMRIGIENIYDTGDQDYFSFAQVKAISKKSDLFKKMSKIENGSEVKFSGRLLSANLHDMTAGYEFSNFNIETDFTDITTK